MGASKGWELVKLYYSASVKLPPFRRHLTPPYVGST